MKIVVDCDRCQGHAMCAAQAPDVYELDDTGYNSMGLLSSKDRRRQLD